MTGRLFLIVFSLLVSISSWAETSEWTVRYDHGDELELGLYTEIREPLAVQLKQLLDQRPNIKELRLTLNSPGGSYYETMAMLPLFKDLKERGVSVTTTVNNGDECDSMCVLIFAQGDTRKAGEVAAFMFHGISISVISNVPEKATTDKLIYQLSLTSGLNQEWLHNLVALNIFHTPGMYWLTGKELFEAGSGYVTELISRNYREKPYNRSYNPL